MFAAFTRVGSGLRKEDWRGSRTMGAGDKYRVDKTMWEEVNPRESLRTGKRRELGNKLTLRNGGKGHP